LNFLLEFQLGFWLLVTYKVEEHFFLGKKRERYGEASCGDDHGDDIMNGGVFVFEYLEA